MNTTIIANLRISIPNFLCVIPDTKRLVVTQQKRTLCAEIFSLFADAWGIFVKALNHKLFSQTTKCGQLSRRRHVFYAYYPDDNGLDDPPRGPTLWTTYPQDNLHVHVPHPPPKHTHTQKTTLENTFTVYYLVVQNYISQGGTFMI